MNFGCTSLCVFCKDCSANSLHFSAFCWLTFTWRWVVKAVRTKGSRGRPQISYWDNKPLPSPDILVTRWCAQPSTTFLGHTLPPRQPKFCASDTAWAPHPFPELIMEWQLVVFFFLNAGWESHNHFDRQCIAGNFQFWTFRPPFTPASYCLLKNLIPHAFSCLDICPSHLCVQLSGQNIIAPKIPNRDLINRSLSYLN